MNKSSIILFGLFLGIISTNLVIASTLNKLIDPCDTLAGPMWYGDFLDLKNNKACKVYYNIYQSYENFYFQPWRTYECYVKPPEFNAVCRQGKLTANFDGEFSGTAYEGMLDMRNENYAIRLYNRSVT